MSDPTSDQPTGIILRPVGEDDLDAVLALNEANTPHVGRVDRERLAWIVDLAAVAEVVRWGDDLAGFLVALESGTDYDSENYRWFEARGDAHVYVDRIAIAAPHRRRGLAGLFYDRVEDHARSVGAPLVTCEVNLDPPNEPSMAFHRARGFEQIGTQETDGGAKRVALLAKRLET